MIIDDDNYMSLLDQLDQKTVTAMKQHDSLAVLTLRQLKTALVNAQIAKGKDATLTDDECHKVLKSEVKRRREAIGLYTQGGRADLAEKEAKEIEIISVFLPPELSEQEVRQKVDEAIAQNPGATMQMMGKIVGAVMAATGGQADGGLVSRLVKEALQAK